MEMSEQMIKDMEVAYVTAVQKSSTPAREERIEAIKREHEKSATSRISGLDYAGVESIGALALVSGRMANSNPTGMRRPDAIFSGNIRKG